MSVKGFFLLLAVVFFAARIAAQKVPDVRVDVGDPPGGAESSQPVFVATDQTIFTAWIDDRAGGSHVFANRSYDGGRTWLQTAVRVDSSPGAELGQLRIAADGPVYVVWRDDRDGDWDIYFNRSINGGTTWLQNDVRLDLGDPPGATASFDPVLVVQGLSVYVAWTDVRESPDARIFFNRSLDRGLTWLPQAIRISDGLAVDSGSVDLAATGSIVHAVWADTLGSGQEAHVRYSRSEDAGQSWPPASLRLDGAPAGAVAEGPRLDVCGALIAVVWHDLRAALGRVRPSTGERPPSSPSPSQAHSAIG